jgi:hypothetical protein
MAGTIAAVVSIGSSLIGSDQASGVAAAGDPFGRYRGQYAQQLQSLEANPSSITSTPGWAAGLQGVERGQAAGGYLGSGNEIAALHAFSGDFYQKELARLAGLAGAGIQPGNSPYQAATLQDSAFASLGYGVNQIAKLPFWGAQGTPGTAVGPGISPSGGGGGGIFGGGGGGGGSIYSLGGS